MVRLSLRTRTYHCPKKVLTSVAVMAVFLFPGYPFLSETHAQEKTDVKASVSGTINCIATSVTLIGNSDTPHARFTWTGPGGFRATSRNAVTTVPGDYTLKVIGAQGSAIAAVKVVVDTIPPEEVKAMAKGTLTCTNASTILTGTSSTANVTYRWTGVNRYSSVEQNTSATVPGPYLLTVTNPSNGCTALATIKVKRNIVPPAGVAATSSGIITCKTTAITLTGTSSTKSATYSWSGPGFSSQLPKSEVTMPGKYTLTVTDTLNGCTTTTSVITRQNTREPAGVSVSAPDTLTCRTNKVTIRALSIDKEANYSWTGPNGFTSSEQSTKAIIPGDYVVNVTNSMNGCSAKKRLTVVQDTAGPSGVSVAASGMFTCHVKSVILTGKSTTPKVTYAWNGPDNFSSSLVKPLVTKPGIYKVTITKPANGCITTTSVTVPENIAVPEKVMAAVSDSLSCAKPRVRLTGSSTTSGVNFNWSGPQDFKSTGKNPDIFLPGNYTLTATNPENGCVSKTSVTVTGNKCIEKNTK